MTKFAKPKPRFDKKIALDGIWVYPVDEVGNEYGGFLVGLLNGAIPRVKVAYEKNQRLTNAASREKRGENTDEANRRRNIMSVVEACFLDWDMLDAEGNKEKFSREKVVDYFLSHDLDEDTGEKTYYFDYVWERLNEVINDVRNFQSDEQNEAGNALGNSSPVSNGT